MATRGFMKQDYNRIVNALNVLFVSVDKSLLSAKEKNQMKILIGKVASYFKKEINEIENSKIAYVFKRRFINLISQMSDYIVIINDTINGSLSVIETTNKIYKEINYDNKNGHFKRKRLI